MTPEQIESVAYEQLLIGAQSYMEDWIDEEGEYSEEDAFAIRSKSFDLILKLCKEYV